MLSTSVFEGYFTNDQATFQQYSVIHADIVAKVRAHHFFQH